MSEVKKYTVEEIETYLESQDSLGDVHYNLKSIDEYIPSYEAEDCEECSKTGEQGGIEYTLEATWKDETWVCNECGACL